MAGEISLFPQEVPGGINLTENRPIYQEDSVVRSRVQKADFALGEHSPGQEELNQSFWLGMEKQVREQAALAEAMDRRKNYHQVSADVVRQAALEGRSLSPAETSFILDRPEEQIISEKTALEERYARRVSEETVDPEGVAGGEAVPEEARSVITKQQIAQRIFEDFKAQYDNTSWASWGVDFSKGLLPFYDSYKLHGVAEGTGATSLLAGENMEEQLRGLYLLPADEFEAKLQETVNTLSADNNILALQFAQAAIQYTEKDALWDSVFQAMDVADVATLGGGLLLKKALKGSTKRVMKDLAKETANPEATTADLKVVAGKASEASEDIVKDRLGEASAAAPQNVVSTRTGTRPERVLNDLAKNGHGFADPEIYTRRAGSLTNERQRRLLDSLENNKAILKSSLNDITHVVRISDEAAAKGFGEAEAEFRRQYFRLEDAIIDVTPRRESVETFAGTDFIEVKIGQKDALPFKSAEQADNYAKNIYKLTNGSYTVDQVGNSYFLKMEKSIDETSGGVFQARLGTDNTTPETWLNTWIGFLRNPDDVRSKETSALAKVSTYGANAVMSKMSEVAKSIDGLGKNELKRYQDVIGSARFKWREAVDPQTGQKTRVQGVFYQTVDDLEKAYKAKGYGMPSDKEIQAYFSFRQLMDYDYAVRNLSVYRDKARQAIDQKSVGWLQTDESGKKVYQKTPFFEGKTLPSLPDRSGEPFTIGWYNGTTGKSHFAVSDRMFGNQWKEVQELLEKDYKIVQVANPKDPSLRKAVNSKGEPIQYLIVRDLDEKPLASVQVPYNEGGHWNYSTIGSYMKQPQAHKTGYGRQIYDGDVTFMHFVSTADGMKHHKAIEAARQMLNDPDAMSNPQGVDAFLQKNTPYDLESFLKLFKSDDNPDGPFRMDVPFVMTQSGQSVKDVADLASIFRQGGQIVDSEGSGHNLLRTVNSQYAQERGQRLMTIKNTGTEANPIFKLVGAPLLDVSESLSRSSAQLAKSRFFDDFKHQAIEDWVTQFADTMKVPLAQLRADPARYLREDDLFKEGYLDKTKKAAARNVQRNLRYLLQVDPPELETMKWARQKVVDKLVSMKGDKEILDPFKWERGTDPMKIARSAVYHMKLGLLNAVQFPLQAQSVIHAAAIDGSPTRAAQANFLYWSMRMRGLAEVNRGAQSLFGKAMSRALGVNQETVEEMYQAFKATGMDIMEGEYARLDDYMNPKQLFGKSGVSKGLDAASVFFKEGNMYHRGVSFATSFLRWRAENPLKKLNATELKKITDRADLYYVNMSRASNNDIMAGRALSVPLQFTTYHKNVMEQLLGNRLTGAEKARVVLTYSAMYGMPIGAGLAVAPIWPVAESVRQWTIENGIDTDSNLITNFMMNGAASVFTEMMTGEQWNVSDRYGPGGLTWLRDLLDGDFFEVAAGASGSSLGESFDRMSGLASSIVDVFSGKPGAYQLTKDSALDALKEISTISNAAKAYYAVTAGQFMTKADSPVVDFQADAADALMIGVLGLSPIEVAETYLKIRSDKDEMAVKKELSIEVKKAFRRAAKASANNDRETAEAYYQKAHDLIEGSGFTPQERASMMQEAMRDNKTLLEKVDRNFMLRDPEKRGPLYRKRLLEGE